MGQRFIQNTVPQLILAIGNLTKELHDLNQNLELQKTVDEPTEAKTP